MQIDFDTTMRPGDIYTRANAGEVFPYVLSPLSWTLLGHSLERGFMRCMDDDFGAVPAVPGEFVACGRMAGRLHLNLSVFRTVAERAPGSTAADLDVQYFGDAVASGLPAHPDEKPSLRVTLRCTGAALRTMARFDSRVARETARGRRQFDAATSLVAARPGPGPLLDALEGSLDLYGQVFGTHVSARALTSSAVSMASAPLLKKGMDERTALGLISRIPDLESAKPSREIQGIAASIDPDGPLSKCLQDACTWQELQTSQVDGAPELVESLRGFISRFGHRGVNEFDPAWRVWGTDPDMVLALLRRVLQTASRDGAPTPPVLSTSVLERVLIRRARHAISRAETTKDNVIKVTHGIRLILDALLDDLREVIDRDDALMLSLTELRAVAAGGAVDTDVVERRRQQYEQAKAVTPAEWSIGTLQLLEVAGDGARDEFTGIGGSPGTARGPVRILLDVDDDFEDGEVLVATMTDTAWTPLFLAASAVVTDTGGSLSHATIVAREIGIPAVVNTKTATSGLRDGDLVEVDGSAGTVRVIERATT